MTAARAPDQSRVSRVVVMACLAVAYAAVGWITDAITPPSIYGIPIWLPAGLALGAPGRGL